MAGFVTICPGDDAAARQAATWCEELQAELEADGHWHMAEVDERTPAERTQVEGALGFAPALTFYFGHGDPGAWLTHGQATVDKANVGAAAGSAVVSVACLCGRELGPEAITAGVTAWLGFTIKVPLVAPYKNVDPIGEAMVDGLKCLAWGASLARAGHELSLALEGISLECERGGRFDGHPGRWSAYYGALALQGHISLEGDVQHRPL